MLVVRPAWLGRERPRRGARAARAPTITALRAQPPRNSDRHAGPGPMCAPAAARYLAPMQTPESPRDGDLNDANPHPPADAQERLRQAEEASRKLDSPRRTNESTVDPEKPERDILDGFHGG